MNKIQWVLLTTALVAIGLAIYAGSVWQELNTAVDIREPDAVVNVPMGGTTDEIVRVLEQKGVIAHALPLKLYIKLVNAGPLLKAGDYTFKSPISPVDVLQKIELGEQGGNKITIVEGWNRWDIARAMIAVKSLKLTSPKQVLSLIDNTSSVKDLDPDATSLEGYMFPETYFVLSNSHADQIISEAVAFFKKVWQRDLAAQAKAEHMSVHEVVTIASIIETEAKLKEERPVIASVIYNRLQKKMPLGMDSTIVYASKLAGKWHDDGKVYQSDIDRVSPYNTRKIVGLPIAPVACPGLPSLQAALRPAQTNYLYYVRNPARNDGAHNFYSDETSFGQGVQALRDWEKRRDQQEQKTSVPTTKIQTTTTKTTTTVTTTKKTTHKGRHK